jgi:hypothetical protein
MRIKMQRAASAAIAAATLLAGCHSHRSGGSASSPPAPATYGIALADVGIVRTADRQALPLAGLPARGATLTVQ